MERVFIGAYGGKIINQPEQNIIQLLTRIGSTSVDLEVQVYLLGKQSKLQRTLEKCILKRPHLIFFQ